MLWSEYESLPSHVSLNLRATKQSNLLVADPKALQYIFHTSGYRFPKTGDMHHLMNSVFGPGIITVEGKMYCLLFPF